MAARLAIAFLVLTVLPANGWAAQRSTGSVRGVVVDARTGQPLARARVTVDRSTTEGKTNAEGRFILADLDAGTTRLEVSLVGYGLARREIEVPAGGSLELTIPLTEGTGTYTEEVHVSGALFPRDDPGVASQIVVGSAELQNLRSMLADDPFRAVQTLPGVSGSDEDRSEFSIRASDFRHVGVTLDGVPSPLLVHTVRNASDTGSLAMINSDILDSVSLSAGSYPQRYGNRTGAQVDFRTREGSRDRRQVRISVSAINASLVAEGPFGGKKRGSWLVSARKSYIDWLLQKVDPEITGTFGFIDTQGKAAYDVTPRQTLQLNMVAGRSRYDEHRHDPNPNVLEAGFNRSVLAGITWRSSLSPGFIATQRVYAVYNRFSNQNDTAQSLDRGTEDELSYRADVSVSGPRRTLFESGVHVQRLHADGVFRGYDGNGIVRGESSYSRTYGRLGAYVLARMRPLTTLTISPGLRVDRWDLTNDTKASPWVQAELLLPRSFLVAGGGGLYRQSPEIVEVTGPQGALDPRTEQARHADVGLGQQVGAYRWQVTLFSRREDDMLRLPDSEPRLVAGSVIFPDPTGRYENALTGTARGIELNVQRRSVNGVSGWIGYSFVSGKDEDRARGESFPMDVEQRHTLNVYGHYRLSSRLSVSGRLRAATNTPLVGYYREVGGRYFLSDVRNQTRLPFYSRLDLRGNRTFDLAGGRLTLFVEIINAYNRRNLRGREAVFVVRRTGEVLEATEKLFPIVPSAGFLLEF